MAKVPSAVEILPKITIADRQTTDGRATAYSERERKFNHVR